MNSSRTIILLFLYLLLPFYSTSNDSIVFYQKEFEKHRYTNLDSAISISKSYLIFSKFLKNDTLISDAFHCVSAADYFSGNYFNSLVNIDSSIYYAKKNPYFLCNSYNTKALVWSSVNDYDSALFYYNKALSIAELNKFYDLSFSTQFNLNNIYHEHFKNDLFLKNSLKALKLSKLTKNKYYKLLALNNLSILSNVLLTP